MVKVIKVAPFVEGKYAEWGTPIYVKSSSPYFEWYLKKCQLRGYKLIKEFEREDKIGKIN